jgi:hypothetical protein
MSTRHFPIVRWYCTLRGHAITTVGCRFCSCITASGASEGIIEIIG